MTINAGRAFLAGAIGGAAMSALMAMARAMGMTDMNLEMTEGAMVTREVGTGTYLLGFVMHLVISGLIALIYAVIFEAWHRAGWWRGALISLGHILVAGIFMWLLPMMHPAVPEHPELIAPGFLAVNFGLLTVAGVIMSHLVYGSIVGAMYHLRHGSIKDEYTTHD